jgi:hypothetical protein
MKDRYWRKAAVRSQDSRALFRDKMVFKHTIEEDVVGPTGLVQGGSAPPRYQSARCAGSLAILNSLGVRATIGSRCIKKFSKSRDRRLEVNLSEISPLIVVDRLVRRPLFDIRRLLLHASDEALRDC